MTTEEDVGPVDLGLTQEQRGRLRDILHAHGKEGRALYQSIIYQLEGDPMLDAVVELSRVIATLDRTVAGFRCAQGTPEPPPDVSQGVPSLPDFPPDPPTDHGGHPLHPPPPPLARDWSEEVQTHPIVQIVREARGMVQDSLGFIGEHRVGCSVVLLLIVGSLVGGSAFVGAALQIVASWAGVAQPVVIAEPVEMASPMHPDTDALFRDARPRGPWDVAPEAD
jgi:hypothetical protein